MVRCLREPQAAASLFAGWEETILWSCLSGRMGRIYANDPEKPSAAVAILGDFRFYAGEPSRELALLLPEGEQNSFFIAVPRDEAWSALLADCWRERACPRLRYAIKKEPGVFDRAHLEKAKNSLPPEYRLEPLGPELFARCGVFPWCADLVKQFPDWETFSRYALGFVVTLAGEPVAGGSTYSSYPGGIEIEIDTREDHRRRGLAYAAGAALILECLDRGWYPSWDAHNPGSLALAEKLGYHFSHEYPVYEITLPETEQ